MGSDLAVVGSANIDIIKPFELFNSSLNTPQREREHPKMSLPIKNIEPLKLFNVPGTSCIYMVDKRIRDQKPDAYTPDTVCIGPYHRDYDDESKQMQAMEALKSRYVEAVLDRTEIQREEYKDAINAIKPHPLECYFVPPDQFLLPDEMLVDGLFIIELFRKYAKAKAKAKAKVAKAKAARDAKESDVEVDVDDPEKAVRDAKESAEVDADDPIICSNLMRARVIRDLALLENQIPMSVLQTLFNRSKNPRLDEPSLVELALDFFDPLIPNAKGKYDSLKKKDLTVIQTQGSNIEHKHLLDLLSFTLEASLPPHKKRLATTPETIPCVTELQHSGVRFKSRGESDSFLDLKFNNGVFEIPPISVNDFTDSFFRNLIAYEQHRYEGKYRMTSYAHLMDYLINSAADVASLRDSDIILNYLGDDKKVASLFNNLCCEILTGDFIYDELCDDVRKYYKYPLNEWKASLQRDFCNSPWTIIPVVAAAILLFLSLWSALFSAFPVFNVSFKH